MRTIRFVGLLFFLLALVPGHVIQAKGQASNPACMPAAGAQLSTGPGVPDDHDSILVSSAKAHSCCAQYCTAKAAGEFAQGQ